MIPCSNRIQEILEWVNGDCIADIGCDHAYVVCNAILNHQSKKGYACDVAQGPLDNAKKTIVANNLEDFDVSKPENVQIYKVNVDDELTLAKKYGVSKLPTLIYFKDGKIVKDYIGVLTPQELLEASKENFK